MKSLAARHDLEPGLTRLGLELIAYGNARMSGLFTDELADPVREFEFDVVRFSEEAQSSADYRLSSPLVLRFVRTEEQQALVARFLGIYGSTIPGLSRILSKVYVRKLFRMPIDVSASEAISLSNRDLRFGQAALTGLNEFS
jgi:hypothetical protein